MQAEDHYDEEDVEPCQRPRRHHANRRRHRSAAALPARRNEVRRCAPQHRDRGKVVFRARHRARRPPHVSRPTFQTGRLRRVRDFGKQTLAHLDLATFARERQIAGAVALERILVSASDAMPAAVLVAKTRLRAHLRSPGDQFRLHETENARVRRLQQHFRPSAGLLFDRREVPGGAVDGARFARGDELAFHTGHGRVDVPDIPRRCAQAVTREQNVRRLVCVRKLRHPVLLGKVGQSSRALHAHRRSGQPGRHIDEVAVIALEHGLKVTFPALLSTTHHRACVAAGDDGFFAYPVLLAVIRRSQNVSHVARPRRYARNHYDRNHASEVQNKSPAHHLREGSIVRRKLWKVNVLQTQILHGLLVRCSHGRILGRRSHRHVALR
mmetsp:Transcript_3927/g.9565  ORF Transcript_3927/g.9565 Transcript_3927/m.9565 type:complete len:383 (+) Transcript_3927:1846-2994(+)